MILLNIFYLYHSCYCFHLELFLFQKKMERDIEEENTVEGIYIFSPQVSKQKIAPVRLELQPQWSSQSKRWYRVYTTSRDCSVTCTGSARRSREKGFDFRPKLSHSQRRLKLYLLLLCIRCANTNMMKGNTLTKQTNLVQLKGWLFAIVGIQSPWTC